MCTREYYMFNFIFMSNRSASIEKKYSDHICEIYIQCYTLNEIMLYRDSEGTETVEIIVLVSFKM